MKDGGWREGAAWIVGGLGLSFICAWIFEYSWLALRGEIDGIFWNVILVILGIPAALLSIPAKLSLLIPGILIPGFLDQTTYSEPGDDAWFYRNCTIFVWLVFAALFLPEIKNFFSKSADRAAHGAGYLSALSDPTAKKPKINKREVKQNTANTDLSAELQKELNRIERLQAKLKNTDADK